MNDQLKVAVIGAGISGLSAAYWLKQNGFSVKVFEKGNRTGGSILTVKEGDFLLDMGPNSTLETSEVLKDLIKDLGIEHKKVYSNELSNKRYILKNGKLVPLPMSFLTFIKTPLFSLKAKLKLLKEPFIKASTDKDISLADFVRYRLGREFLDYAINPFVAGVYAGNPETLSTPIAFPKLYALEQKYGSLIKGAILGARERKKRKEVAKDRAKLFSFTEGMEVLPNALVDQLQKEINLATSVQSVKKVDSQYRLTFTQNGKELSEQFDKIVFAIPTFTLSKIISTLDAALAETIGKVIYPPVAVVTMAFKKEHIGKNLDGFGFLVPEKEKRGILGSIWSSVIFPNRASEEYALFTTFIGGTRQPQLAEYDDKELTKLVKGELSSILQIDASPELVRIKRWEKAIPQYTLGYQKVKDAFDQMEKSYSGLHIIGNSRQGISVGDSVVCAYEKVKEMSNMSLFS